MDFAVDSVDAFAVDLVVDFAVDSVDAFAVELVVDFAVDFAVGFVVAPVVGALRAVGFTSVNSVLTGSPPSAAAAIV